METLLLTRHLADTAPDVAAALVAGTARGSIAWAGTGAMVGRAPMADGAEWLLARAGDGAALLPGAALACRPGPGIDLSVPEYEIEVAGATATVMLDASAWAAVAEDARLLRAALILGAAEHCLDTRRRARHQPPAVRPAAGRLPSHAPPAGAAEAGARGDPRRSARAVAADAAPIARQAAFLAAASLGPQIAEATIQAHGGMGFTWDIPVHRYLRRIRSLEAQGEAPRLREAVAAALIEGN